MASRLPERAGRLKFWAAAVLTLAVAALLRLPALQERPMHADEAVLADKFATLVERGEWQYDPQAHHGPALAYLSLVAAWARGQHTLLSLDEVTVRLTPAVAGVLLCLLPLGAYRETGGKAAALAGGALAVSPALVYYSRDFIPETPFVFASAATVVLLWRWSRRQRVGWALAAGVSAGVAMAAKETWVLSALAAAAALMAMGGVRYHRHLLWAALTATAIAGLLYTGFGARPEALGDVGRSLAKVYPERAFHPGPHQHPWWFYLRLAGWHQEAGATPFTEGVILLLAGWGAWVNRALGLMRFLALYSAALAVIYSLLPYKTPWCLLTFWWGFCWLAGAGAAALLARRQGWMLVAAAGAHLGAQAFLASRVLHSHPANPWVYAQTLPDIFVLCDALAKLPAETRIQIVSRENLWPLPWYLRRFPRQEWSRALPPGAPAPVVLLTPEAESALIRRNYEELPPGERHLLAPLVPGPIYLRPGVELRAYAAHSYLENLPPPARGRERGKLPEGGGQPEGKGAPRGARGEGFKRRHHGRRAILLVCLQERARTSCRCCGCW